MTTALERQAHHLDDLILSGETSPERLRAAVDAFAQLQVPAAEAALHHRLAEALYQTLGWRGGPAELGKSEDDLDDLAKAGDPYARARQLLQEHAGRKLNGEEAEHVAQAFRAVSPILGKRLQADPIKRWMLEGDDGTPEDASTRQEMLGWLDPGVLRAAQRKHAARERQDAADAAWEAQAVELGDHVHLPKPQLDQVAGGKHVWLYHGTTSKFLPNIMREGLRDDRNKVDVHQTVAPGVRLTARPGRWGEGGTAAKYAEGAAHEHGGKPVVLRVKVSYDDLEPDVDDEDLSVGRHQFTLDSVPPEAILESNGKRLTPAAKKGKCRTCGSRWKTDPK